VNPAQLLHHFDCISEAPDAIPRLRRFILDLAVRGKLAEQDPRDEPASELLTRIQDEKARLVKTSELKKLESFEPVEAHEIPFTIPLGWEVMRMGWLARKLGAGSTPLGGKAVYQSEGVPLLRSQNVHDDGLRLNDVARISRSIHERMSGTHVQHNDILLNITGASIGRCALVSSTFVEGNVSQHVAIIRLFLPDIRQFIHLSLTSPLFQKLIDDVQVGVSREGLSMQRLRLFSMLIPPLAEQQRIVAKVDELMALCDRLEAAQVERENRRDRLAISSLNRLNNGADADAFREHARFYFNHLPRLTTRPEQIQQLRQTILNLAVRGKLVPQDPQDETASDLLTRIQAEKARLVNDGKIRKHNQQSEISEDEVPFALPPQWAWTRLGDVIHLLSGQHLQPSEYTDRDQSGTPYITGPADFGEDGLVITRYAIVRKAVANEGQILLTVKGAGVGKTAICDLPEVAISRQLMAMTAIKWSQQFLLLATHRLAETLKESARSLIPGISREDVDQFVLALPPVAEQQRIVAKVDELMALCDRLEAQLTTTHTDSRRLLEAVLHEVLATAV
jgi:type I restriction enzyme S subunit